MRLTKDNEVRQETAYRIGAQFYAELILDKLGHHLSPRLCLSSIVDLDNAGLDDVGTDITAMAEE